MEEKPSARRVKSEEDHVAKKVKTEEDHGGTKSLDTAKADKLVWLMKLPQAVAKSWNSHPSSDPHPVAKVVLSLDPLETDETSAVQFKMEVAPTEAGMKPKNYSMNMSKDFIPMCVFSEGNQGKIAVEGKVEHKFDMKPHGTNFEEYGKMCRERTNKSMIKNRQIQDKKKPVPVKQSDVKRTRRDRGELEDIMFKLFERQPNWALKQLVQETDQPAQFLKEILNELCVYNKRGTNQGTYELKPEYKKSVDDTPAE
ncbi:hypothetical protein ABKV19_019181 [Rosa sericea]